MRRRVLGTLAVAALLLAVTAPSQARVIPSSASTRVSPAVTSPRIGYVYGSGITDAGGGITVYAQQANGALTQIQQVLDGDSVHSTVIVHLRSGMALYDLTRGGLFAFHINAITGMLTQFTIPAPTSTPAGNGLAAYDPLAHGLPGQPMLVTGACGTAGSGVACPFEFQTFLVNPATGALSPSNVGGAVLANPSEPVTGDGLGHFAVGLGHINYTYDLAFAKIAIVGGQTTLVGAGTRTIADNATGQSPVDQSLVGPLLITPSGMVDFPAGPLQIFPDHPAGWVAYSFGSVSAAPYESRVSADVTASAVGRKAAFVGESGGTLSAGHCAVEAFGLVNPGLGGVRTVFPCNGSPAYVTAMFEQGAFMYVARYQEHSLGFHDVGAASLAPTAQVTVPNGSQIYSWAGFLFGNPTVTVPAKVSMKAGIPVTIGCQQACAGSTSAIIRIAGSTKVLRLAVLVIKPHAAGTFAVKLIVPTALRPTILQAIRAHHLVRVTTTTKVVAGIHSVSIARVSTMGA